MKFSGLHLWLLAVQVVGCLVVYGGLVWFDPVVAQGGLICVLAPTATAAAVITGMLGGSVACLAAYTLMSSLVVAVVSPLIFTLLGEHSDMTFWNSVLFICRQVMPVLILPFALALFLEKALPSLHRQLKKLQILSFYLWALGLTIVTGKTVYFIRVSGECRYYGRVVDGRISIGDLCPAFILGRRIGRAVWRSCFGEGQGLRQKNTILAIWMAQVYLNPLSSIAPASYVLWQNMINSWQLWKKGK